MWWSHIKNVFCCALCFLLVFCSVNFGDDISRAINAFVNSSSASEVEEYIGANQEIYSVTGYGGGDYTEVASSVTFTDIEDIKQQAQEVFNSYTKAGIIKEVQMGATRNTVSYGIVEADNKTDESIDLKALLSTKLPLKEISEDKPSILIYHTHSTEGYEILDLGWYAKEYNSRTKDVSRNMIRVGDELTSVLEEAGFIVIHDRNIYDEAYDGAYSRSRVSVEQYLKEYPSIQITLDVHRDAIHYDDGTKCKPTVLINGKKAAQVMIITGCEGDGVENFSSWKTNLTFATHLQSCAEEKYNGLMRPIFFCNRKYNMDVTPFSLLLEFGTDANTLEEAVYSARLIGNSLVSLLEAK